MLAFGSVQSFELGPVSTPWHQPIMMNILNIYIEKPNPLLHQKQQNIKLCCSKKWEIFTLTAEKLLNNCLEGRVGFLTSEFWCKWHLGSWKNPDAVRVQMCSRDLGCVYINSPAVSTSSLVAVQASPQAQSHFYCIHFHSDKVIQAWT